MIVKFHARGTGIGSGPVDYLLGKDRLRKEASLLRGDPEMIVDLIDSSRYSKKYTSGVLSFAEENLPYEEKQAIMDGFEATLFVGLDADQYACLWVEHRDKGRLELNFVIPNIELASGKRLQPYYDAADKPRVNAWKDLTNDEYRLHDPNDPANKRTLVTANTLPRETKQVAELITQGLLHQIENNQVHSRTDIIRSLTEAGFSIARTTPSSISIANPAGGKNIRLKGQIYEQDFRFGQTVRADIERASQEYQRAREERLLAARKTYHACLERKREEHQYRYKRTERPYSRNNVDVMEMDYLNNNHADNRVLGANFVAGNANRQQPAENRRTGEDFEPDRSENIRGDICHYPERQFHSITQEHQRRHELDARQTASDTDSETLDEDNHAERVRNTLIERIRAATAAVCQQLATMGGKLKEFTAQVREDPRRPSDLSTASAELVHANSELDTVHRALEQSVQVAEEKKLEYRPAMKHRYKGPSL